MSKKGSPAAPAAPDPVAMSQAQGAANKDTAITQARLNAVDQNSPFGSVTYTEAPGQGDGSVPKFTQNISLSPDQQRLYNTQSGIEQQAYDTAGQALNNAQGTLSSPFSLNNLPGLATGVDSAAPKTGFDTVGPQYHIAPAGTMATQVGYSNPIQSEFDPGGPLASNVAPAGQIQQGLNVSGIPQTPLSAADFAQQGQQVQDALMQRFDQDLGRRQDDVESRLNAQGIQRGSEGFTNAQGDLSRARNDALGQAILLGSQQQNQLFNQALSANQNAFGQRQAMGDFANAAQGQQFSQNLAGGQFQNAAAGQQYQQNMGAAQFGNQAQQQGYNQALSNGQFANDAQAQQFAQNAAQQQAYNQAAQQATSNNQAQASFYNTAQGQAFAQALQNAGLTNQARQQSISEQQLMRSQPINEIATLLGLGGGIQTPTGAPQFNVGVQPTDVMGAYGLQQQALQNQYNQQMQSNNAMWGGLSNLAGSIGGAALLSDRRAKNVIRRVGETATGIPLYLYEYKHAPGTQIVGVMAQDMQARDPAAVHAINGILHVDYARVA